MGPFIAVPSIAVRSPGGRTMNRPIYWLAPILLSSGCITTQSSHRLNKGAYEEGIHSARNRAAFEYKCPKERIQPEVLSANNMEPTTIGVTACENRGIYARCSDGRWVPDKQGCSIDLAPASCADASPGGSRRAAAERTAASERDQASRPSAAALPCPVSLRSTRRGAAGRKGATTAMQNPLRPSPADAPGRCLPPRRVQSSCACP